MDNDSCIHFNKDSISWSDVNMSKYDFGLNQYQLISHKFIIDELVIIKEMTEQLLEKHFEDKEIIKIYIIENNTGRRILFVYDKNSSKIYAVLPVITNYVFSNFPVNVSMCNLEINQEYNLELVLDLLNKSHFTSNEHLDIHGAFKYKFIIEKTYNFQRKLVFISGDLLSENEYLIEQYPNNFKEIVFFLNYLKEFMNSN